MRLNFPAFKSFRAVVKMSFHVLPIRQAGVVDGKYRDLRYGWQGGLSAVVQHQIELCLYSAVLFIFRCEKI